MTKDRAQNRKKQILWAAFQAVYDKGFNNVTLQDIADYAEVSKGVASYYFDNKEDVFCNLLEWITNIIFERESQAISKESTALGKLRSYINAVFITPADNRKFYRVYLDFLAQASHNEQFRKINDKFYENCWNIGREIIELGLKEKTFVDVDVEKGAHMMRALIDGNLIQWLMRNDDRLFEFYRDSCYEAIASYLTNQRVRAHQ